MTPELARMWSVFDAIPPQVNPHGPGVITRLDQWVAEQGLVVRPKSRERFAQADFGWFAAVTYPTADAETLALVADWFAWLFLLDDQLDDGGLGSDPVRTGEFMAEMFGVLTGLPAATGAPTIITALSDLWDRSAGTASATWRRRFVDHVIAGGLAARWEADNRAAGVVPSVESYVDKRPHTGAVYVCMDLIELAERIDVPAEVYDSEPFADALRAACDVVGWVNDLYSVDKETALGEYHNLVSVTAHSAGVSMVEASAVAADLISERVLDFLRLERAAEAAWPRADVRAYLDGMRSWMRGNLDWSATTRRYRDVASGYLERGLVEPMGEAR
ncbi:terpene synthase family protein [Actinokineospora sp. HUAS TT18]|uniref:terpene synthase family protein n=1 Tax=Actinokineospora sp. HUAS TT18 TaxID=3447451 RepID=UPI003F52820B